MRDCVPKRIYGGKIHEENIGTITAGISSSRNDDASNGKHNNWNGN
ncbi:hypothetical protein MNV_180012 [Candidatus Methanoperedens nitroreducens]|uniref:Uncharacterized protein n=1 Tax=Candidatus Methanoperedens nitratireducens TaxID=1392998 RepID=A0A284VM69_9EURY|nr:hypothetical protein MNV_180012 [Candidatus Methanoperedens nitroreducens]